MGEAGGVPHIGPLMTASAIVEISPSPHRCRIFAQLRNQMPACRFVSHSLHHNNKKGSAMNSIIYLVGLVVIVMAVLSFVGLH